MAHVGRPAPLASRRGQADELNARAVDLSPLPLNLSPRGLGLNPFDFDLQPSRARPRRALDDVKETDVEFEKGRPTSDSGWTSDMTYSSSSPPMKAEAGASAAPQVPTPTSGFRAAIRNFSSQWFLVPQGMGITSIVLFALEDRFDGLDIISYVAWGSTGAALVLMLLAYALRVIMFPRHVFGLLGSDPAELSCLSSISIAFTSVIQMVTLTVGSSSVAWAKAAVGMWWFNAALATASMVFIPFSIAQIHSPGVAAIMPNTQLPMVAAITLAAGGGMVANSAHLDSHQELRAPVILVSYFSLSMAVPIAMAYAVMYLTRLLNGSPPARGKVYQEMIFCGPWSQGSFALQVLGQALVTNAPGIADYLAGGFVNEVSVSTLGYSSVLLGFMSWGAGSFWWAFAIMSTTRHLFGTWRARRPVSLDVQGIEFAEDERERYSLAAWALVFPWGVYTNAAIRLGKVLASRFFRVWSTILAICLVLLMLTNLILTFKGLWTGRLLGIERRRRREPYNGEVPALYT